MALSPERGVHNACFRQDNAAFGMEVANHQLVSDKWGGRLRDGLRGRPSSDGVRREQKRHESNGRK
jgi:hypothetical protein